jgi:3-oxoadipate enol-lactonase
VRDMDQREEIRQIQTPTLIVAGTEDPVTTTTDAKFMAESIPGAELLALKAAHLSNIEAAQQFTAGVMDFLRE